MEFRVTPAPRPSSAEEDEIKLAQILEVHLFGFFKQAKFKAERQLVIETQQNYKQLKEKFLEVTEQLDLAKKELQIVSFFFKVFL